MRVRPCSGPRFQYVLVESKYLVGRKAWKIVLVERKKTV